MKGEKICEYELDVLSAGAMPSSARRLSGARA